MEVEISIKFELDEESDISKQLMGQFKGGVSKELINYLPNALRRKEFTLLGHNIESSKNPTNQPSVKIYLESQGTVKPVQKIQKVETPRTYYYPNFDELKQRRYRVSTSDIIPTVLVIGYSTDDFIRYTTHPSYSEVIRALGFEQSSMYSIPPTSASVVYGYVEQPLQSNRFDLFMVTPEALAYFKLKSSNTDLLQELLKITNLEDTNNILLTSYEKTLK